MESCPREVGSCGKLFWWGVVLVGSCSGGELSQWGSCPGGSLGGSCAVGKLLSSGDIWVGVVQWGVVLDLGQLRQRDVESGCLKIQHVLPQCHPSYQNLNVLECNIVIITTLLIKTHPTPG